jgi:hypothetical protein
MSEHKSFLMYFVEMVEQYHADRQRDLSHDATLQLSCLRRFLRWLTPNGGTLLLALALIATAQVWAKPLASPAAAPGPSATTVNYQGRLADPGGTPLDGAYGMSFSLWDAASDGNLVWGPENHTAVPVSDGLFSVGLGSQTSGGIPTTTWNGDRYLEITVGGETLAPRELIRSVPIAGMALTVLDGAIGSRHVAPSWYGDYNPSTISTTSTEPVPTDVSVTFTCDTACTVLILHRATVAHTSQDGRVDVSIYADGEIAFKEVAVPNVAYGESSVRRWHQMSGFDFVNLSEGLHTIDVRFECYGGGTCYYIGGSGVWEHLNVLVLAQS